MPTLTGDAVTYPRTKIMAPFSFFGINNQLSADFLFYFEAIDTTFTRTVDIHAFLKKFCPRYVPPFLALWRKFYVGIKSFFIKGSRMGAMGITGPPPDEMEDFNRPDYQTLTFFLLLLMSVRGKEGDRFLYWLWFDLDDAVIVDSDNILDMLGQLYPTDVETKKYAKMSLKLRKATRIVDTNNFSFKNFGVLDMQTGSPFLKQLTRVQKELTLFILDAKTWKVMTDCMAKVNSQETIKLARRRLDERVWHGDTKVSYRSTGERKKSRVTMGRFIDMYQHFIVTSVDIASAMENLLPPRLGWLHSIKEGMKEMWSGPKEEGLGDDFVQERQAAFEEAQGPSGDGMTDGGVPSEDGTATVDTADNSSNIAADDMHSLTKKFRRELKWPLPQVYSIAAGLKRDAIATVRTAVVDVIPVDKIDLDMIRGPDELSSEDEKVLYYFIVQLPY